MQVVEGNPPSGESDGDFAERYCEEIIQKVYEWRQWGVGDVMFRNCPREHLANVAFIFLHHFEKDERVTAGELH